MNTFHIEDDFIELCKLIKNLGWVNTGGMAKHVIAEGLVTVNGTLELRKRYKTRQGDVVRYESHSVTVLSNEASHEH